MRQPGDGDQYRPLLVAQIEETRRLGLQTAIVVPGSEPVNALLTDHVKPEPRSETRNPKSAFATTLIQGFGVGRSAVTLIAYSRPSKNKAAVGIVELGMLQFEGAVRSPRRLATAAAGFARAGRPSIASSCDASEPRSPRNTIDADAKRSVRSSGFMTWTYEEKRRRAYRSSSRSCCSRESWRATARGRLRSTPLPAH